MDLWKVDFIPDYLDFFALSELKSCVFAHREPVGKAFVLHMEFFAVLKSDGCVDKLGKIPENHLSGF